MMKIISGIVLGVWCAATGTVWGGNMVPNGDFEAAAGTHGWMVERIEPGATEKVARTGGSFRLGVENGNHFLRMKSAPGEKSSAQLESGHIPLLPNTRYELAFRCRSAGLRPEDRLKKYVAYLACDLFIDRKLPDGSFKFVGGSRIQTEANSPDWRTLDRFRDGEKSFMTPDQSDLYGQIRVFFDHSFPGNQVTVDLDEFRLLPLDKSLENGSFEDGTGDSATFFHPFRSARARRVTSPVRSGKYAVEVVDAPVGNLSGISMVLPVRPDRRYRFSGYGKGGVLNPHGGVGGGALSITFIDAAGESVGDEVVSNAVGAEQEWTKLETRAVVPPGAAVAMRLTAGMSFCEGTAWFDDLELQIIEHRAFSAVRLKREESCPDPAVTYASNLLFNGDAEIGDGRGGPAGWRYIGSDKRDWTEAAIRRYHGNGRPDFNMGRGRGIWSDATVYQGKRALVNENFAPPPKQGNGWAGSLPVDGYWQSEAMKCESGRAYMAAAWIRPGRTMHEPWIGPLQIVFFDAAGVETAPLQTVRNSYSNVPGGAWSYWITRPFTAPPRATTMRLRVIQEIRNSDGGWGALVADNMTLWQLPEKTVLPVTYPTRTNGEFNEFYHRLHRDFKPPYQPAPALFDSYQTAHGKLLNAASGNLFHDPGSPRKFQVLVRNLLGESRRLQLSAVRTDAAGKADAPVLTDIRPVSGYGEAVFPIEFPPVYKFGASHVEFTVLEDGVPAGTFAGRYGHLPMPGSNGKGENIWAVMMLRTFYLDGNPEEEALGKILQIGGYGLAWQRLHLEFGEAQVTRILAENRKLADWYRRFGLQPIIQIMPPLPLQPHPRTLDYSCYRKLGSAIGAAFPDARAFGNWGIEQANTHSPFRGDQSNRVTDEEYDRIMAALYDGLKETAPQIPVITGNIATDWECVTLKRLYQGSAAGKFDGVVMNAYMGMLRMFQNTLAECDRHGDTGKGVWSEEHAAVQACPMEGEARRYGELDAAANLVIQNLTLKAKIGSRLHALTNWMFFGNAPEDWSLITAELQPRPQFIAQAVLNRELANAEMVREHEWSGGQLFEFERESKTLFAGWTNGGKASLTMTAAGESIVVRDLFGNETKVPLNLRVASISLGPHPVYISGTRLALYRGVELSVRQMTRDPRKPRVAAILANRSGKMLKGVLTLTGTGTVVRRELTVEPGKTAQLEFSVSVAVSPLRATEFEVSFVGADGVEFRRREAFAFAFAAHAGKAIAINGSWDGWPSGQMIEFGTRPEEVHQPSNPALRRHQGKDDLRGEIRMAWDAEYFYLGVEAFDDRHLAVREEGGNGFMADSLEFGIQPSGIRRADAKFYEYEIYRAGLTGRAVANRRFPLPSGPVTDWRFAAIPSGKGSGMIYQAAIPWRVLGGARPPHRIAVAAVLNDRDFADVPLSGDRKSVLFYDGVNSAKTPEKYGEITLLP